MTLIITAPVKNVKALQFQKTLNSDKKAFFFLHPCFIRSAHLESHGSNCNIPIISRFISPSQTESLMTASIWRPVIRSSFQNGLKIKVEPQVCVKREAKQTTKSSENLTHTFGSQCSDQTVDILSMRMWTQKKRSNANRAGEKPAQLTLQRRDTDRCAFYMKNVHAL